MASGDEQLLKELLPFLDVLTPVNYKLQILEHILGMTGTADGVLSLSKNLKLINKFISLIPDDPDDKTRLECLKILVNLTSTTTDKNLELKLLNEDFICYLLRLLTIEDAECCDFVAMLLTNLTREKESCEVVYKCIQEDDMVKFEKIIDAFCIENYNKQSNLHYIGSFLANLTLLKDVRLRLLDKENSILQRLFPFTQYEKSVVRRLAVARMIMNCLFETEYHDWLLSEDVDILPFLLLPLAGPEEFTASENDELPIDLQYLPNDKQRETNREIIILLAESLFQLCSTKSCRLKLKDSGSYYVLRELHKSVDEEDVKLGQAIENVIHVLIGDEPASEEHDNLREIKIPEDVAKKFENVVT